MAWVTARRRSPEPVHLLSGAYAVHALPHDERAFYERHLTRCATCRSDVRGYAETAALLAAACTERPPTGLRRRVLTGVERSRQVSPITSHDRGRPRMLAAVAAALVAAVVGLSGVTAHLYDANRRLEATVAAPADTELAIPSDALPSVLAAADVVALDGEPDVSARFLHSAAHDRGMLVVEGLAAPADGRVYQLWLLHDGRPLPAGVFAPSHEGEALIVEADAPVRGADTVAVTVEPAGGVRVPTGEVVLRAEL